MVIHEIPVPKSKLNTMPAPERALFIQLGHLANEINMLQKLVLFSMASPTADECLPETRALNSQAFLLARLLAGKLVEAWDLLEKSFFGTKISGQYETLLTQESKKALNVLKQYFGKRNLLREVRNQFAFHFSVERLSAGVDDQINKATDPDVFKMYLGEAVGNSFYYFADVLTNLSMLQTLVPDNPEKALQNLLGDVVKLTNDFLEFIGGCMIVIANKYFGSNLKELNAQEIELVGVLDIDGVELPFFVSKT